MRSDERGSKSVGFHVTGGRWYGVTRSEGGCGMGFRSGLPQPHSSIYLIPLWLAILKRPSRVPGAACRSGTIATPPKSGGACGPKKRCAVAHPFSALMTGRYRPHLSLREGLEQPPFPSRFIVSDWSSPSRVRFAASRLDGSGPIRKTRCSRGERGGADQASEFVSHLIAFDSIAPQTRAFGPCGRAEGTFRPYQTP